MKFIRKLSTLILLPCLCLSMFGCVSTGDTDLPKFIEKFNENMGEESKIEFSELMSHDNTYYAFFPSGSDSGEYMLTVSEDKGGKIFESGICIVGSIPIDISFIEALFSSELYSLYDVTREKSTEIFKSLKLNETDTYKKVAASKNPISELGCIVEIIVNDAGTGIYIYKDEQ